MKTKLLSYIVVLGCVLLPVGSLAQVSNLIDATTGNGSFEADGTAKQTTWDTVTDWNDWGAAVGGPSTANTDSGVENTPARATDGVMLAFLQGGNAAYNLTSYVVQTNDYFVYTWDFTTAGRSPASVQLAYQDASSNIVAIAGTDTTNPDSATPHLGLGTSFLATNGHPAIGKQIAITITAVAAWPEVDNFVLQVGAVAPLIVQQPVLAPSEYVVEGTAVTITSVVDGTPPLTIQWVQDGSPVSGGTNQVLAFAALTSSSGDYAVWVSNAVGSVTSDVVSLSVTPSNQIDFLEQPVGGIRYLGGGATFSASVLGVEPLSLQWELDGSPISGATNDSLTVTGLTAGDFGDYVLVASNTITTNSSSTATLTLRTPASGSYEEGVVAKGPLGYWRLDETNGAPVALEYMNGYDGAHVGGVSAGSVGPRPTDFDGMESDNDATTYNGLDAGTTTGESLMSNLGEFTMMGFLNPVILTNAAVEGGHAANRIAFFGQNDVSEFGIHGEDFAIWTPGSGVVGIDKTNVPLNVWSHIACVGDGSNVNFYLNGALLVPGPHTATTNYGASTSPFNIGYAAIDAAGNFFEGIIDEVALYDKALTQPEVNGIYNLSLGQVAPSIVDQPQDAEVVLGTTNAVVNFVVQGSGTQPLTFQWKKGGVNITDETNTTLTITDAGPADEGIYTVGITNVGGGVLSDPATLTMISGPVAPGGITTLENDNVAFTVTMPADSTGYLYQWSGPGGVITDATNATVSLDGVQTSESGVYTVEVTLGGATVTGDPATLSVLAEASVSYETTVSNASPVIYWRLGETNGSTVAVDELVFNDGEYLADTNGIVAVQLGEPGALLGDTDTSASFAGTQDSKMELFDPLDVATPSFTVEFWAMATGGGGFRSPISNRDLFEGDWSGWMFYATSGNTWQFWAGGGGVTQLDGGPVVLGKWTHVAGSYDAGSQTMSLYIDGALAATQTNVSYASQSFNPLWVGSGANEVPLGDFYWVGGVDEVAIYDRALSLGEVQDHFAASFGMGTAPVITFDPQDSLAVEGAAVSVTVGARGLPLVTYQWQKEGVNVPGANTESLDFDPAAAEDGGLYRCIVTNPYGSVTSGVSQVEILPLDVGISFNMREVHVTQILATNEVAGYYPLPFWNDILGTDVATNAPQPLPSTVDSNGDAVDLDVRWSLSNTWGDGTAGTATPDAKVARGYFDDGDNPGWAAGDGGVDLDGIGVSVTVSNVPYSSYSVVIYRTSDQGSGGSYGWFSVNGVTNTTGTTSSWTDLGSDWVLNENMLIFDGLTDGTLTIRVQARNGTVRGSMSGFQIISPEAQVPPVTIGTFGIDGAGTYNLSWNSSSGTVYAVESESDLVSGPWGVEPGAGAIGATGETASWTGTVSGAVNNYRVVENPS